MISDRILLLGALISGGDLLKIVREGAKKQSKVIKDKNDVVGPKLRTNVKQTSVGFYEDFCDVELCRFQGEDVPRKHIACVKKDVRIGRV